MIVIGCENISISYGTDVVLDKITFSLNEGEKLGIVGINGAGKTTLMRILCGEGVPDEGKVFLSKNKSVGYFRQNSEYEEADKSIFEKLTSKMPDFVKNGSYEHEAKKAEYSSRVKGVLKNLGFSEQQYMNLPISTLSGGQKTRISLAEIILNDYDILMLDEPTNHLDITALNWLESYLKKLNKTLIIISHDRFFLDSVTDKTLEIENSVAKIYNGNYSFYANQKKKDREIQRKHYQNQQKEIARIQAFIEQQRSWNRERNIIAAESRQKILDRMVKLDKPVSEAEKMKLKFNAGDRSGDDVLLLRGVSKAYPEKELFSDVGFELKYKDRMFLFGENGCGKSTLIKIICGKLEPTNGNIEVGYNVIAGYYDQENQNLNDNNTVVDELWSANEQLSPGEVRNTLAGFLFYGDDCFKEVSKLSGGERARLSLAKLILSKNNLLILDEPTNHLDITSREVLEQALSEYDGTILAVSHDRYFVNKLSDRMIVFGIPEKGKIFDFKGSYSEFCDYRDTFLSGEVSVDKKQKEDTESKLSYQKKKEEASRIRKEQRKIELAKQEMLDLEHRLEEIDRESAEFATDHEKLAQLYEEKVQFENRLLELYELLM